MARRIQDEDIKSAADLITAGGTASQLPNAAKLYLTSYSKTLAQAIVDNDIGGSRSVNFEIPGGVVNSINTTFTLTFTPAAPAKVLLFIDGVARKYTTEFTITGSTLNMVIAPTTGQDLMVFYVETATGSAPPYYQAVVGSAGQVSTGQATHSTIASAIAAVSTDAKIFILTGTYSESVSVSKRVNIQGQGYGTQITGTWTYTSAAAFSTTTQLRVGDNITFNASADGIFMRECWQATGKLITDNGSGNSKLIIQE